MTSRDIRVALLATLGTLALVHIYQNYVAPAVFERRIRRMHKAALEKHGESEPCVLDVHPDGMRNYKQGRFEPIIDDLRAAGLPVHLVNYTEKLLIARGVAKAFLVREELVNYKKVLKHFISQYEEVETELRRFSAVVYRDRFDGTDDEKYLLVALQRSIQLARGCSHILKDARTWTRAILNVPRYPTADYRKMFEAGDTAIWVQPDGMLSQDILDKLRRAVAKEKPRIRSRLNADGWPPTNFYVNGPIECKYCHHHFGRTWVRNNVCWKCDDARREQGVCPYCRDNPKTLCPHRQKCFGCEQVSCEECGLVRGDGVAVADLAARINPVAIFLDFDQTLCNTKSGAAPVLGKARFNPELVDLARGHPNVHVVTRQNPKNTPALLSALGAVGMGHATLHCLGRTKIKKADVIAQHLHGNDAGLFVDDTTREHLDPAFQAGLLGLRRVLFSSTNYSLATKPRDSS